MAVGKSSRGEIELLAKPEGATVLPDKSASAASRALKIAGSLALRLYVGATSTPRTLVFERTPLLPSTHMYSAMV